MTNIRNLIQDEKDNLIGEGFPLEAFPGAIQEIIKNYNRTLNFNSEFSAASVIYAFSLGIGNNFKLKVKRKWIEPAMIYIALVGKAGVNKSAPLTVFSDPFRQKDKLYFEKYKEDLEKYRKDKLSLKKGTENTDNQESLKEPERRQLLISDTTYEGLTHALNINPHGLGLIYDELAGLFKNFNKYNNGSEEEAYLSIWSGKEININRKNGAHIYISDPFVSLIGTIQPEILIDTFSKGRNKNGFTHRMLFTYPDKIIREDLPEEDIAESTILTYEALINIVLELNTSKSTLGGITSQTLELSKDAFNKFTEWRRSNNGLINKEIQSDIAGLFSKLETYLLRLSLITQIMRYACKETINLQQVELASLESGIKIIEYFRTNALKVNKLITKYDDPLTRYSLDKRKVYASLPMEFSTGRGEVEAKQNGMPRRTFFEFITDDFLFTKIRHGQYAKNI